MLDEYLTASKELKQAREEFTGYEFGYFYSEVIDREYRARTALNQAFKLLSKS